MNFQIAEIFRSIEGETTTTGFPATFIRLSGCNLNCSYCDSTHAKYGGQTKSIDEIMSKVQSLGHVHHVTVTGGEPLLQSGSAELIDGLCKAGFNVQVETNGSYPFREINKAARIIADVKTPSSNAGGSFLMENLNVLKPNDEIKFVICTIEDYAFAKEFLEANKVIATVNFSAAEGLIDTRDLAQWILRDALNVRLNIQLHKILNMN